MTKKKSASATASAKASTAATTAKDEGKYLELEGAVDGKVVVRFPPEASGYLHIGHAKAALLNAHYQRTYNGKLIFRFDDTNPEKEKESFEKIIEGDVELLEIKPDSQSYTSDFFELIMQKAEQMIRSGKAYCDDTAPEQMKTEREERVESANRSNSVEKNLKMWEEMKNGSEAGLKCCLRAKIDMKSDNGALRDPTIYRCKPQEHPRTGFRFKVYPTYDFACPIVDSHEGVTHSLRTSEYMDRDAQFYWFCDALEMRRPQIAAYSRLNLMNTVLSKRKLTFFVEQGMVDGWDDPRMPTVRGVLRRGLTVEGLKQFIASQGSSKAVVVMDWDKIWSFNRKVIDPIAGRYSGVEKCNSVTVSIGSDSIKVGETVSVALHPKNPELGQRPVNIESEILIDQTDAHLIQPSTVVTFINWGNLAIESVERDDDNLVSRIVAKLNLENKDFKKTLKVSWLAKSSNIPATLIYFDHIIRKPVLGKDDDFKQFINLNSKCTVEAFVDLALKTLKRGQVIQLQRKGFFICDEPYDDSTVDFTGKPKPIQLISIPDGSTDVNIFPHVVQNWKKENVYSEKAATTGTKTKGGVSTSVQLDAKIRQQGDQIRMLKEQKASKEVIKPEVDKLLQLKKEFKEAAKVDWTPDYKPTESIKISSSSGSSPVAEIDAKIRKQGDQIRMLKEQKASKEAIKPEVDKLLQLKKEFKEAAKVDWTPDYKPTESNKISSSSGSSPVAEIDAKIRKQGDQIRMLKEQKASKESIKAEVDKLLQLKKEFKEAAKVDWTPDFKPTVVVAPSSNICGPSPISDLDAKIRQQGDQIRMLKEQKASKEVIKPEVDKLLQLKKEFKETAKVDWTPDYKPTVVVAPSSNSCGTSPITELDAKIRQQGDQVRKLKEQKASKEAIKAEVDKLLQLKKEFKEAAKVDWNPDYKPPTTSGSGGDLPISPISPLQQLDKQILEQGDSIRGLKSSKAEKAIIDQSVQKLLSLKAEYKKVSGGIEWKPTDQPAAPRSSSEKKPQQPKPKKQQAPAIPSQATKQTPADSVESSKVKKQTRLGMEVKKGDNYSDWYTEVITKAEMIEYYDVSGCYILRPWSYAIWEKIQHFFDSAIKEDGVQNCYFPIFISKAALETEKTHIADFAPEVAWVTKSGQSELAEPIAIRPTSETVMYPTYGRWIQSHRDLPIRLNQWCNVVRWEFKQPTPFLRTREFLWQEGHSAFATKEEALEEVYKIQNLYASVYEDLLAIPVVKGRKTEKEKFAGGDMTTTVEAYVHVNGRGIQGATSHYLGQNFSKMFDLVFEDPTETGKKCYAHQNSWGLSTRSIGALIMIHGDDKGLVLPPRAATIQVVIVPCGITATTSDQDRAGLLEACSDLQKRLRKDGKFRVQLDVSDHHSPGWKFNHWELKGVPIRIELGPKDLAKGEFVSVRRDSGLKQSYRLDGAIESVGKVLEEIQRDMFNRALKIRDDHLIVTESWQVFLDKLDQKFIIIAPFCGEPDCEEQIKKESAKEDVSDATGVPLMGAKSLCIPLEQPKQIGKDSVCIRPGCSSQAKFYTLFGRSY